MSPTANIENLIAPILASIPLTIIYVVAVVMSVMSRQRIGNAAIFAAVGFTLFLAAQGTSSFTHLIALLSFSNSTMPPYAPYVSMICDRLISVFLQATAYILLIFAFVKRIKDEQKQEGK